MKISGGSIYGMFCSSGSGSCSSNCSGKGREEERKDIIKKLLSKGKNKEEILSLIDITSEEYEKLIN